MELGNKLEDLLIDVNHEESKALTAVYNTIYTRSKAEWKGKLFIDDVEFKSRLDAYDVTAQIKEMYKFGGLK